jgi:non-specific serine/threonine protein kinase
MSSTVPPTSAVQGPSHADALPAGTRLGEFELDGLLGVGGFGLVYRAFDRSLQRPVAIKEYLPGALVARGEGLNVALRSPTQSAAFERGLQGFLGEARLLASFDHPSLVKVYRFWEAHGTAYMAMPLYQGMTLQQARAQMHGPPPEAWLRQVIGAMLGALQCLHEHQTLHRDVAPDNIFAGPGTARAAGPGRGAACAGGPRAPAHRHPQGALRADRARRRGCRYRGHAARALVRPVFAGRRGV